MGNWVFVTDGTQIVESVQINVKKETQTQNDPLDEYLLEPDLDDLVYPEGNKPEDFIPSVSTEITLEATIKTNKNSHLTQLIKDIKQTQPQWLKV